MRTRALRFALSVGLVSSVLVFMPQVVPTAQANSNSPPPLSSQVIDSAAQRVVDGVLRANQAAFSVPESLLGVQKGQSADGPKSLASAQRTDAALEGVRETASMMASAMAIDEMSALHVDRVEVTRSGIPVIESTGPSTVARVDLTISRHVKEDDVDWVEVIPHEITLDVSGNIQSVTAIDLEWRNAHSVAEDLPVPKNLMHR